MPSAAVCPFHRRAHTDVRASLISRLWFRGYCLADNALHTSGMMPAGLPRSLAAVAMMWYLPEHTGLTVPLCDTVSSGEGDSSSQPSAGVGLGGGAIVVVMH